MKKNNGCASLQPDGWFLEAVPGAVVAKGEMPVKKNPFFLFFLIC